MQSAGVFHDHHVHTKELTEVKIAEKAPVQKPQKGSTCRKRAKQERIYYDRPYAIRGGEP